MTSDTIYALATGRPPAAISIIRVSGPKAHEAGRLIAGALPPRRQASVREFRSPGDGELLDHGLLLRFDRPASSTGEDSIEFHIHGSRAVADALLGTLDRIEGVRLAKPGEFTRRAFENGRIDLTEAEGLADLIEAETESQRRAALAVADGGLRRQVADWQAEVLQLSARAEAAIDYVGDDEISPTDESLYRQCATLAATLAMWLERPRVEPLKHGIRVVVAGPPNAGKSSLINAIAGEERAIVTPIPGTTRDHIEVPLAISGIPLLLTDTAGIRDTDEPVERIGVSRSRNLVEAADLLVWLGDIAEAPPHPRAILVHARSDQPGREIAPEGTLAVSSVTCAGIADLLERIAESARTLLPAEDAIALNRRHAKHLEEACAALAEAADSKDAVFAAEHLRAARVAFDRLTGRAGVDDVLDALFGRFCLGK